MADASIRQKGETYQVRIRMNGLQCEKSLGTRNEREAMDRLGEIRRTVRHIDEGLLTAPEGVDLFAFILSGGKLQATPQPFKRQPDQITLKTAWERYRDSFPPGSKESLRTESIHARHFFKVLKAKTPLESITFEEMQRYANARGKEKGLRISNEALRRRTFLAADVVQLRSRAVGLS